MRIQGRARVDRRTKSLTRRIGPGEVAVISHTDLDAPCSSALLQRRVAAVINAQRSLSGRFPHSGPGVLVRAGIPLIDNVGEQVIERIREGDLLEIADGSVYRDGELLATGEVLTETVLAGQLAEAKLNVSAELARFVENTLSYVSNEQALLLDTLAMPTLNVRVQGRHCLIVVRGTDALQDLRAIRSYVEAVRPVLIGVDGGADLLIAEGYRPDIIIGDMDSVSDEAIRSGAQLIVHAYPDGSAPGQERLDALGVPSAIVSARGTSEDVAMLLAYEKGAELIAAVGTHFSLSEFLEKARGGMSSTFLVRLKVGSLLVDAKGISRLYPAEGSVQFLAYIAAIAAATALVLLVAAPGVRATLDLWMLRLISFVRSLRF
jgi:uncharacterized membrane-anchored protein